MSTVHELKCWPGVFQAAFDGRKRFEFRKDDRGFKVGDVLRLCEFKPCDDCDGSGYGSNGVEETECGGCHGLGGRYTQDFTLRRVTYILRGPAFGVPEGYCVMSVGGVTPPRDADDEMIVNAAVRGVAPTVRQLDASTGCGCCFTFAGYAHKHGYEAARKVMSREAERNLRAAIGNE